MDPWVARIPAALRAGLPDELRRLEEIGLNASATPRQLFYDGWLLRLSPGKAKRARSVNPFYASTIPLDDKLAACADLFARAELPLLIRVTPFVSPPDLDDQLHARGFVAFEDTRVMTVDLTSRPRPASPPHPVAAVDVDAVIAAVSALRSAPQAQVAAHAERLRGLAQPIQGFVVRDGAAAVCGGLVVTEPPWAGIFDVVTAEAYRGRGLASALTTAMLDWAADHGASRAYLQVDADNAAARAVYGQHGFVDRYAYWYRRPAT